MTKLEQRIKAYGIASLALIIDDMTDDESAKLDEDAKQWCADYIERFPLSSYNGNDTAEQGGNDGK